MDTETTPTIYEQMINSPFAISGKDINERWFKKKIRQPRKSHIYFNALREINQKRLKNDKEVMKLKKKQKNSDGTDYICPHCKKNVHRLTSAHVGIMASTIINQILDETPEENWELEILDKKVRDVHNNITIVVCCDACNKRLED